MTVKFQFILFMIMSLLTSCEDQNRHLPILGNKEVANNEEDTIYHTIPYFSFIDQDSIIVTPKTFENKIYVADFFFTSCTTICPIMKTEMKKVYDKFKGNEKVLFLSHTIDPGHDSIPVLKSYANSLGVDNTQWHFVTGDREKIFDLAEKHFMISAQEDASAPGGAVHSGAFILLDQKRRIRGYYDGTNKQDVNQLISDIPFLLKE